MLLVVLGAVPGYGGAARAVHSTSLAPGLSHEVWTMSGERIHVARRAAGPPVRVQLVQAHDALTDGPATTSSMCRRTRGCQIAVNGDVFVADGPVGAVVADRRMVRSPRPNHDQLSLEPLRATTAGLGEAGWSGSVARDGHDPLPLDGVNVALAAEQPVPPTRQNVGVHPVLLRDGRTAAGRRPAPVQHTRAASPAGAVAGATARRAAGGFVCAGALVSWLRVVTGSPVERDGRAPPAERLRLSLHYGRAAAAPFGRIRLLHSPGDRTCARGIGPAQGGEA